MLDKILVDFLGQRGFGGVRKGKVSTFDTSKEGKLRDNEDFSLGLQNRLGKRGGVGGHELGVEEFLGEVGDGFWVVVRFDADKH